MTDEVKNKITSDVRTKFYHLVANDIGYEIFEQNDVPVEEQKQILQQAFNWFMEKYFDN
jgi:hypothetical protein